MNTVRNASKLGWLLSVPQSVKHNFKEWIRREIVDDDPYDQMLQDLADSTHNTAHFYQD